MKFFTVVAPLVLLAGLVAASPDGVAKRACTPSKCVCNEIQGEFCGTSTINPDCVKGHVYECSPSGNTCDFGIRTSCQKCNKLVC
ncbi:hypothetical protein DXG01_007372 [Tephrocybe rancida]|nr:hypothetical protein DXG01_007372 [Tephrocybe rancida]